MTPQPYKICPKCSQQTPLHTPKCLRCGREFRTQFPEEQEKTQAVFMPPACDPPVPAAPLSVQPAPNTQAAFVRCVVCQSDTIQRVASIVQQGVSQSSSVGSSVTLGHVFGGGPNFGMVGVSATQTAHITALAHSLAPPEKPALKTAPPEMGYLMVFLVFFFAILTFFALIIAFFFRSLSAVAILPIVAFIASFWGMSSAHSKQSALNLKYTQEYPLEMRRWEQSMHNWDSLVYCSRCDHVYHIGTGRSARPTEMRSLL